jgi:hypothetical protein
MATITEYIKFPNTSNGIPQTIYRPDNFKTSIIGTSDCNEFVPFYSLLNHQQLKIKDSEVRIMEYALPLTFGSNVNSARNFRELLRYISNPNYPMLKFNFTIAGASHSVYIYQGLILSEEGEILVALGINTEHILNNTFTKISSDMSPSNFTLFISSKLDAEIYKNLKKKLEKEYFSVFRAADIDIITTSRTNKWVFKNNFKKPKFKSVKEMNMYLQEVPKVLISV